MRCTLILSDLTFPPSQGLHEQSLGTARLLAGLCEELQIFIYCKDRRTIDEVALLQELPGRPTITIIPYTGSHIRRGCTNLLFGKLRSAERDIASAAGLFGPDFVHLDMAVAAGLHRIFRNTPGVISWMDPGSRRQFRFALAARGYRRVPHFAAGLVFYLFESLCRSRNKVWHVVSPTDRRYLERAHPGQPVVQIPVSITSLGESDSPSQNSKLRSGCDGGSRPRALIFLDLRVPHLYTSFELLVKRCLLPLESAGLSIQYTVLGRVHADERLESLCKDLDMEFVVWVDDFGKALVEFDFVILPDQVGTGLKTRAVHVLAAGCAAIGTSFAFEGIDLESGQHAVVADSWLKWQEGIRQLATDNDLRGRLAHYAPEVAAPFAAHVVSGRWENLYSEMSRPD